MDRRGKPTAWQRELMASRGLDPEDYIVISCGAAKMRVAHRGDGSIRKIKRTAGVGAPAVQGN